MLLNTILLETFFLHLYIAMAIKEQIKAIANSNKRIEKIYIEEAKQIAHHKRQQLKKELEHKRKGEGLNKNVAEIKQRQQKGIKAKEQEFLNIAVKAGAFNGKKKHK